MDGAVIGRGSIVAPGAVVREGSRIPPGSVVAGVPAKVVKRRDCRVENRVNALAYHRNAEAYRRGEHRAWDGPAFRAFWDASLREVARSLADDPLPLD
jgi:carbonic anhydrase/acetyltransferase-like protein (isoleucine patch superfamily)